MSARKGSEKRTRTDSLDSTEQILGRHDGDQLDGNKHLESVSTPLSLYLALIVPESGGRCGTLPAGSVSNTRSKQQQVCHNEIALAERSVTRVLNSSTSCFDTKRFNPYQALDRDPVRAQLLLSSDNYRVTWIHLQPGSVFSMHIYTPSMVRMLLFPRSSLFFVSNRQLLNDLASCHYVISCNAL